MIYIFHKSWIVFLLCPSYKHDVVKGHIIYIRTTNNVWQLLGQLAGFGSNFLCFMSNIIGCNITILLFKDIHSTDVWPQPSPEKWPEPSSRTIWVVDVYERHKFLLMYVFTESRIILLLWSNYTIELKVPSNFYRQLTTCDN